VITEAGAKDWRRSRPARSARLVSLGLGIAPSPFGPASPPVQKVRAAATGRGASTDGLAVKIFHFRLTAAKRSPCEPRLSDGLSRSTPPGFSA
jgi:hypothetical protein